MAMARTGTFSTVLNKHDKKMRTDTIDLCSVFGENLQSFIIR